MKSTDEGVGMTAKVEVTPQKKMKNGKCAWWNGTKFGAPGKDCGSKKWLPMIFRPAGHLYFLKLKLLAAAVGTKIENSTAWTRATNSAANIEGTFTRGHNLRTFYAKKRPKRT